MLPTNPSSLAGYFHPQTAERAQSPATSQKARADSRGANRARPGEDRRRGKDYERRSEKSKRAVRRLLAVAVLLGLVEYRAGLCRCRFEVTAHGPT